MLHDSRLVEGLPVREDCDDRRDINLLPPTDGLVETGHKQLTKNAIIPYLRFFSEILDISSGFDQNNYPNIFHSKKSYPFIIYPCYPLYSFI